MDPELLRQRAAFKKHASRTMSVQQRPAPTSGSASHSTYNADDHKKKKKPRAPKEEQAAVKALDFDYKTAVSHSNAANFGTMAKIVDYMKKRHLNAQHWSLSLQEILDEIQVFDLNKKSETWLLEALPNNPRLQIDSEGKFVFKPKYKIKNKTTLLGVLEKFHADAKGGLLLTDLNECIPNGERVLEALGDKIILVPTQVNKRRDKVFFINDQSLDIELDDDFRGLWRNVSVDHLDEKKIEEYLQKHGIDTMRDLAPKKLVNGPPKRKGQKRKLNNSKVQNMHLADVLKDYE